MTPAHLLPSKVLPSCSWNFPGHNPFQGSKFHAILSSPSLTPLEALFAATVYTFSPPSDTVLITSRSIFSADGSTRFQYSPEIHSMNFGKGILCSAVSRNWPEHHTEIASVWHIPFSNKAILLPHVCNNISVITFQEIPTITQKSIPGETTNQIPEPSILLPALILALIFSKKL